MKTFFYSTLMLALIFSIPGQAQNVKLLKKQGTTHNYGMKMEGLNRTFLVHLPTTYDPQRANAYPVVFMLHGGGGSGKKYYNISGWKELGEQKGIITVFPTGYKACVTKHTGESETKVFWLTVGKSANLCTGQKDRSDAAFIRAIVDHLKQSFHVDSKRFYCTGFSNGMGFTLSRTIPELGDIFAAVGGTGSILQTKMPAPASLPVPCLAMIGERDAKLIKHNGNQPFPTQAAAIAQNQFLQERFEILTHLLSLENNYQIKEKPKHTILRFNKPTNGGNQELRFAILKGLGHVYPRGIPEHNNIRAAEVFWDFFQQYHK